MNRNLLQVFLAKLYILYYISVILVYANNGAKYFQPNSICLYLIRTDYSHDNYLI